jgi:hypothetical protein
VACTKRNPGVRPISGEDPACVLAFLAGMVQSQVTGDLARCSVILAALQSSRFHNFLSSND